MLYVKGEGTDRSVADRLDLAGADPDRYALISRTNDPDRPMIDLGKDADMLDDALRQMPDTRLIIVDTLDSLFPSMKAIDNANIRTCFWPLQQLAERRRVAVVIFAHTNKGGYADPLDRLSGARAIGGAARAIWYLGKKDPESNECYMASVKCNDFRTAPTLRYEIVGNDEDRPGKVLWGTTCDVSAWDLDKPPKRASAEDRAAECQTWLATVLADGPVKVSELKARAKDEGFSDKTLKTARKELGVVPEAEEGTFPAVHWVRLPGVLDG